MNEGPRKRARLGAGVWLGLWVVLFALGCGRRPTVAKPVDPDLARSTLDAVLASWQDGETPQVWSSRVPQVIVQDFDWSSGTTLQAYEILGDGDARDANLFCPVRLVVETTARRRTEMTVTYCVGTDPVLTVFRAMPQ